MSLPLSSVYTYLFLLWTTHFTSLQRNYTTLLVSKYHSISKLPTKLFKSNYSFPLVRPTKTEPLKIESRNRIILMATSWFSCQIWNPFTSKSLSGHVVIMVIWLVKVWVPDVCMCGWSIIYPVPDSSLFLLRYISGIYAHLLGSFHILKFPPTQST